MNYLLTASALLDERGSSSDETSEYDDDSWDPTSWISKKAKGTVDDPTDPDYQPENTEGRTYQKTHPSGTDPALMPHYADAPVDHAEEPIRELQGSKRKLEADQSDSSNFPHESDEEYVPSQKQGRLNPTWTKEAVDTLLQLRYELWATFEDDEPSTVTRGWYKIAAMLDPFPCTPQDCRAKFDSLSTAYFKMLKNMQMGAWHDPNEFKRLQYIEKIFEKSPKTAQAYAIALSQHNEQTEDEDILETTTLLDYISRFYCEVGILFQSVLIDRQKREEREKQLENLYNDFSKLREKKRALSAAFVKKIAETLNRPDGMSETFVLMCRVYCSLMDGDCLMLVDEFHRMIAFQNEQFENISLLLSCFSRMISVLIEADPTDSEIFVKLLPGSARYLTKIITPPEIQPVLADYSFKGQLHMNRSSVERLIETAAPFITASHAYSKRISIERQVVLSLWYLVHNETFEQLSIRFSIRLMDVSKVVQYFCTIVSDKCSLIEWPGADGLKKIVLGFENLDKNAFPGVAGALGVKYIQVRPPRALQRAAPATISLQGVVDTNHIFTDLFVSSINDEASDESYRPLLDQELPLDSRNLEKEDVFRASPLWRKLYHKPVNKNKRSVRLLWDEIHLVADSTLPLLKTVMVPFGSDEDSLDAQGIFNQRLHEARRFVEDAFLKTVSRFQRLLSLDYSLTKNVALIKATFGVHNLCMREGDDFTSTLLQISFPEKRFSPKIQPSSEATAKRITIMEALSQGSPPFIFRNESTTEAEQT